MKKYFPLIIASATLILLVLISQHLSKPDVSHVVSSSPVLTPSTSGQNGFINKTDLEGLSGPAGYQLRTFARGLGSPRFMVYDEKSNTVFVSIINEGTVVGVRDTNHDGVSDEKFTIVTKLNHPHGLALRNGWLYIGEEHQVSRVRIFSDAPREVILKGLPAGNGHFTRTLGFGPDGKLYISIGSSCNVCVETQPWRATIIRVDPDGKNPEVFARGLRNAVGFIWDKEGKMWATDNGRDKLGDNLPPDEINVVEEGNHYGWPNCYGQNVHDTDFDKNTYVRNPCMEPFEISAYFDLPAHVAPLGLRFGPDGYLYVALHGSWNRGKPVGYKVIRIMPGENPAMEDFITGFMPKKYLEKNLDGTAPLFAHGRPVDILFDPKGVMYISDDKAGSVYALSKAK